MNNLYLSFSVVFPLFCMMALGYFLRAIGLFNESFLKQLNHLCFKVFLPLILFINIYKSDFREQFSLKLVLFAVGCVVAAFLLLMAVVPLLDRDGRKRGVVVQGIFRSNFILFGIPITVSLYGEGNASVTAILLAFVIPLFNLLSVVALEVHSGKKSSLRSISKGIFTNPLILGAACAFLFVLTGLRLPAPLESTVSDLSKVATPLALLVLGGSFHFDGLRRAPRLLVISALGKLIFMPGVFLSAAIWMGFRGMELAALFAMLASPTAVSSYTMAQSMGADDELAGQIVVVDSIASIVTIFLWLTALTTFGLV